MAGRPTLLTPELVEKAKGYLATCIEYYDDQNKFQVELPSIEGLACFLDVSRDSLHTWDKQDDELGNRFSDILDRVRRQQAKKLLNQGVAGNYNSTIAKLILGKHGYVDHKDITSDGKALPSPILGGEQIK